MSDEISVIKVYDDEMEASMAEQVLENAGIRTSLSKDDGGGLVPSLQLTGGVSLIVNKDDEGRAVELIRDFESQKSVTDEQG